MFCPALFLFFDSIHSLLVNGSLQKDQSEKSRNLLLKRKEEKQETSQGFRKEYFC
jgi:hypothetical protein